MGDQVTRYVSEQPAEDPKWLRTAFLRDDGTIFMPVRGNERSAYKASAKDRVNILRCGGHYYFPTWWVALSYPKLVEEADGVVRAIKEEMQ